MAEKNIVKGELKKLVREISKADCQRIGKLVTRLNSRYPDFVARAFDAFTVEQAARQGLSLAEGRLVTSVLPTVSVDVAPAVPTHAGLIAPLELVNFIKPEAISETVVQDKRISVYMGGYGRMLAPSDVPVALGNASRVADRIDIIRRSPSVLRATVSTLVHKGEFDAQNGGYASVANHARRIISNLAEPGRNGYERFGTVPASDVDSTEYALNWYEPSDVPSPEPLLTLELNSAWGSVTGSGGLIREISTDKTYMSPGRVFQVTSSTRFAVSPDMLELLPQPTLGERQKLSADDSLVLEEYIAGQDVDVLAPAVTLFKVDQALLVVG